jgi:universal stress protein E
MNHKTKIKKVLVVLSPDLIRPDKPMESALIRRAISLAKITGCELELFHVCYDGSLDYRLFESDVDLRRERELLTDHQATQLAEVATRLKNESVSVRHEVRWDSPRTDAILRKIAQAKPDLVMKQAREHSYFLGLSTNTDWDLARKSPAHLWLVNDEVDDIDRIVAAVGNKTGDPGDITTASDYDLLRTAGLIGDTFKAAIYPVNAYQLSVADGMIAGVGGMAIPPQSIDRLQDRQKEHEVVVKKHSGAVRALAQYFGIPKANVYTREGHPNDVIPDVASKVDAHMIVLGANSINRLERIVSSVTVEPVISDANCDILVVRERDLSSVPDATKSPFYGIPQYDLQHAITDPEAAFESPQEVANVSELSIALRNRILQAWEYDIRAQMAEENEGGPVKDIDVNALDEVCSARELLKMKSKTAGDRPRTLSSASA